jgi:coenzyme PQQ precursor peptide PqqA
VKKPNPVRAEWPSNPTSWEVEMRWTKPEAEVVAVTMEVTAYVATL